MDSGQSRALQQRDRSFVEQCRQHVLDVMATFDEAMPRGRGIRQRDISRNGGLEVKSTFAGPFVRALLDSLYLDGRIEQLGQPRQYRNRLPFRSP